VNTIYRFYSLGPVPLFSVCGWLISLQLPSAATSHNPHPVYRSVVVDFPTGVSWAWWPYTDKHGSGAHVTFQVLGFGLSVSKTVDANEEMKK
jgi:hypothetical protein